MPPLDRSQQREDRGRSGPEGEADRDACRGHMHVRNGIRVQGVPTSSQRVVRRYGHNGCVTHTHDVPELHAALERIGWLVGTWWGFGVGGYPTIESFRFEQELTFSHDGRPFPAYESKARLVDDEGR